MDAGKFIVSDGHLLVQKITELAVTALTSEMTPHNMARSLTALSFGLSLRVNKLLGWDGHQPSISNFDIDAWTCRFSCGSRNALSDGPRPPYNKVCLIQPFLLHRLLHLVYTICPAWLGDARSYLARPGAFASIMTESGIGSLITMPLDTTGGHEVLTVKSMRSISASMLP